MLSMRRVMAIVFFFIHCAFAFSAGESSPELLVLRSRVMNDAKEFTHIAGIIDNVLELNLRKQKSIRIAYAESGDFPGTRDFDEMNERVWNTYRVKNCLTSEYYVNDGTLTVVVLLWDSEQKRIKDAFVRSMPNDLDMLSAIELMCGEAAENIGRKLPALEREAYIAKRVNADLREKVDAEERILDRLFSKGNEIQFALLSGFNMGRTAVSFSSKGCLISPSLNLEYSILFRNFLHVRLGAEYLPFHVADPVFPICEASAEILFGFHTASIDTFSFDTGIAVIYDKNSDSTALSYYAGTEPVPVTRAVERISISIPLEFGFYIHTESAFFLNVRLRYHGLTWTMEPLPREAYNAGTQTLKYASGFSLWNLFFVSVVLQGGFRF